jgi:hypothetical protein
MSPDQARSLVSTNLIRTSGVKAQITLRDLGCHPVLFHEYFQTKNTQDIQRSLFPTPCAQDYKHRGPNSRQQGLADVVRRWPAPTRRGYKNETNNTHTKVPVHPLKGPAANGQLSADWTEALMGYPRNWTALDKNCSPNTLFPHAWIDGSWETGIPRVVSKQKNRRKRVTALGNSIVPQIPYLIFLSEEFNPWRSNRHD